MKSLTNYIFAAMLVGSFCTAVYAHASEAASDQNATAKIDCSRLPAQTPAEDLQSCLKSLDNVTSNQPVLLEKMHNLGRQQGHREGYNSGYQRGQAACPSPSCGGYRFYGGD
jgi:hypothetical protein